jgi:hypothetical protein
LLGNDSQFLDDFGLGGKSAFGVFRIDQLICCRDIENAIAPRNNFRVVAERTSNDGRQTGGPRQIVSTRTVFDDDLHGGSPRMRRYGFHFRRLFHDSRNPAIWLELTASIQAALRLSRTLAHDPPGVVPRFDAVFPCPVAAQEFFANVPTNRGIFDSGPVFNHCSSKTREPFSTPLTKPR